MYFIVSNCFTQNVLILLEICQLITVFTYIIYIVIISVFLVNNFSIFSKYIYLVN